MANRDTKAAMMFFKRSIKHNEIFEKVNIDNGGANKSALIKINKNIEKSIEI